MSKKPNLNKICHSVFWQAVQSQRISYFLTIISVPSVYFSIWYLKENQMYFKEIWEVNMLKKWMSWLTLHLRNMANAKVLSESSDSLEGEDLNWQKLSWWLHDIKLQEDWLFSTERCAIWRTVCLLHVCIHFPVRAIYKIAFSYQIYHITSKYFNQVFIQEKKIKNWQIKSKIKQQQKNSIFFMYF